MAVEDKFADELMSDEELDQVAGGNWNETIQDVYNFEELGVEVFSHWGDEDFYSALQCNTRDAFYRFGVTFTLYTDNYNANEYFIDGKKVSREEVWKHIKAQLGK